MAVRSGPVPYSPESVRTQLQLPGGEVSHVPQRGSVSLNTGRSYVPKTLLSQIAVCSAYHVDHLWWAKQQIFVKLLPTADNIVVWWGQRLLSSKCSLLC